MQESGRCVDNPEEYQLLEYLRRDISQNHPKPPPMPMRGHLDTVLEHCEKSRGVLAVLMTLLLKKALDSQQDIRLHQAGMDGGFSGRGMDSRVVTPFLKHNRFPAMQSGSGWLTRSLEQAAPYDMNYPGKINPPALKDAFLRAIDEVQVNDACPKTALSYILAGLVRWRDRSSSIRLSRPTNLTITRIVRRLRCHFDSGMRGAARLPVLAVYAAYQRLVAEMDRYKDCRLSPLESHTAADQKTGSLGDVQVMDKQNLPMEAVEIKHGVRITPGLVRDCYAKFRTTPVKTFYLLSTDSALSDAPEIETISDQIRREHGCQLIVNGILETLAYYLRLMKDTSAFVDGYVKCVEDDAAVNYDLKMAWESAGEDKDDS